MSSSTSLSQNHAANTPQHNRQLDLNNPKLESRAESKEVLPDQMNSQAQKQTAQERLDSYYADKDLAWWIELARDFKRATRVPLPEETQAGL
jgi:hypothetical protein